MNVSTDLDRTEALLWTILLRFESLAAEQYAASARALLTPEKEALVALLRTRVHGADALQGTRLDAPIATLMTSLRSTDEAHVLIAQGLFLELIGQAIYRSFGENDAASSLTRRLCECGSQASARARAIVPGLLRSQVGEGDVLLQAIMTEAGPLLRSLDDIGEGIDVYFFERFDVRFADLMGDVAAELIAECLALDVDRRKLVAFITSALMGL